MRSEPEASAAEVPGSDSKPKRPGSIPTVPGWARLGGLVVLVAATSFAVASVSPWLMVPYLALMAWLTLVPGALEPGEPQRSAPEPTRPSGSPDRSELNDTSPELARSKGSNDPEPSVRVEVAARPKRGRSGRGRARSKAATPEPSRVAWVRVGPNQFVRVEEAQAATDSDSTPSTDESAPGSLPLEPSADSTPPTQEAAETAAGPDRSSEDAPRPEPPGRLESESPSGHAPGDQLHGLVRREPNEVLVPVASDAAGEVDGQGWFTPPQAVLTEVFPAEHARPETVHVEGWSFAGHAETSGLGVPCLEPDESEAQERTGRHGEAAEVAVPVADWFHADVQDAGTVLPQAEEPARPGATESATLAVEVAPEAPSPAFDGETAREPEAIGGPTIPVIAADRPDDPPGADATDVPEGSADPEEAPEASREVGLPASPPRPIEATAGPLAEPNRPRLARAPSLDLVRRPAGGTRRFDRRASARRPPLARGTPRRRSRRGSGRILRGGLTHDPRAPPALRGPRPVRGRRLRVGPGRPARSISSHAARRRDPR